MNPTFTYFLGWALGLITGYIAGRTASYLREVRRHREAQQRWAENRQEPF